MPTSPALQNSSVPIRWARSAYAATVKFANELRPHNVSVNAMCPGWVHTDMGGPEGDRTPDEGADTALWLASLAPLETTGGFFTDRRRIPW